MLQVLSSATPQRGYCTLLPCRQQSTAHAVSRGAVGLPVQADSVAANHIPALQTAEVSRCSITPHFMPERNFPLGQAEARKTIKAFLLAAEYPFPTSKVPKENPLLVYSLTPLVGQDRWPEQQQFVLQTLLLL